MGKTNSQESQAKAAATRERLKAYKLALRKRETESRVPQPPLTDDERARMASELVLIEEEAALIENFIKARDRLHDALVELRHPQKALSALWNGYIGR